MGWKNWPNWVRGGVIGILFAILSMFLFIPLTEDFFPSIAIIFLRIDFISLIICKGICEGEMGMIQVYTILPSYFLIGALIGWFIGKIKSKNNKK